MRLFSFLRWSGVLCAGSLMAACGSSGGDGPVTNPPVVASSAVGDSSVAASSSSIASSIVSSAASSISAISSSSSSSSSDIAAAMPECAWLGQPLDINSHTQTFTVEIENFDICDESVSELTSEPNTAGYRDTTVGIQLDATVSNGYFVGATAAGEHLEYTLNIEAAGFYTLTYRARAQANTTPVIAVSVDGEAVNVPTVSAQEWADVAVAGVYFSGGLQVLRVAFDGAGAELDAIRFQSEENDALTAVTIVANMGTGLNLGNTLDVPRGQDWGATRESKAYFEGVKAAGFDHVRIPVTWDGYTADTAPYAIEAAWMARVEQAIDWALAEGLYVIVNAHHEIWLKNDFNAQKQARIEAIWQQVAEHFKNKPKRLIFEILNEPHGMTIEQVDGLNPILLAIMRESNPDRAVVFSGSGFTPYTELLKAKVPAGTQLIGNYHSYDPWQFAGQCTRGWGSNADKADLRAIYQAVADWAVSQNLPATVNEFGAAHLDFENPENVCDVDDRKAYLRHHVVLQKEFGIPGTAWDDDGSFQIYKRASNTWDGALGSLIF